MHDAGAHRLWIGLEPWFQEGVIRRRALLLGVKQIHRPDQHSNSSPVDADISRDGDMSLIAASGELNLSTSKTGAGW